MISKKNTFQSNSVSHSLFVIFWLLFALGVRLTVSMKRGAFILFEGVDRCGKSTQSALLSKFIQESLGKSSELIRFPDRTTVIGGLINQYLSSASDLNDQSIHLLFSANRWEKAGSIEESLKSGTSLVRSDLFVFIIGISY
jgi:dTMP kinase